MGGGSVEVSIQLSKPVQGAMVRVGQRVGRGPHWSNSNQDGGAGCLGTVLGYRLHDGSKYGQDCKQLPVLHAVVKWDKTSRKYFYSIGDDGIFKLAEAGEEDLEGDSLGGVVSGGLTGEEVLAMEEELIRYVNRVQSTIKYSMEMTSQQINRVVYDFHCMVVVMQ